MVSRINSQTYDERGRMWREIVMSAGPDQRANTADDTVIDYDELTYDGDDRLVRRVYFSDRGADAMSGTADDGAGPDGMWFTADDVPDSWIATVFDASSPVGGSTEYKGPGPDHVWLTADDEILSRTAVTLDERRLVTSSVAYHGPGSDGVWDTGDDAIATYTVDSYDAAGVRTDATTYAMPGPDGVWFTADDLPQYRYEYDAVH
jgi:hypothetical protein